MKFRSSFFLLIFSACETGTPVQTGTPALVLESLESTCTEAVMRIEVAPDLIRPFPVSILRDGNTVRSFTITGSESLFVETGLAPLHRYSYSAVSPILLIKPTTEVQTQDTTTHLWTFEEILVGRDAGINDLYDVSLSTDSTGYAVGEMYFADTLGNPDPQLYNALRWNGGNWQHQQVPTYVFCGQPYTSSFRAVAALCLSPNEAWIAEERAEATLWNGSSTLRSLCLDPENGIWSQSLWGSNSGSVYLCGRGGAAQLTTSGIVPMALPQLPVLASTITFRDIFGDRDGKTLFICGSSGITGTYLLRNRTSSGWELAVDGTSSSTGDSDEVLSGLYRSLYLPASQLIFIATTAGCYLAPVWTKHEAKRIGPSSGGYPYKIRGSGANNIFMVGDFGDVRHFNGLSWQSYPELLLSQGVYYSVAVRERIAVIVGRTTGHAIIVIARRP